MSPTCLWPKASFTSSEGKMNSAIIACLKELACPTRSQVVFHARSTLKKLLTRRDCLKEPFRPPQNFSRFLTQISLTIKRHLKHVIFQRSRKPWVKYLKDPRGIEWLLTVLKARYKCKLRRLIMRQAGWAWHLVLAASVSHTKAAGFLRASLVEDKVIDMHRQPVWLWGHKWINDKF